MVRILSKGYERESQELHSMCIQIVRNNGEIYAIKGT
jgi:hypothetical protein